MKGENRKWEQEEGKEGMSQGGGLTKKGCWQECEERRG